MVPMESQGLGDRETAGRSKEKHLTASQKLTELRNRLRAKFSPLDLCRKGVPWPIADKLSKLASCVSTSAKPQTYFRFMDLPDELQLKIVAYAIEGSPRTCALREPPIYTDKHILNKWHNPLKLETRSPRIKMAEVNRKIRAMTLEFYPQCFTVTKDGKSVRLPVRFNLNQDRLIIPQWMIRDPNTDISNLTMVKFIVITYVKRRPNSTTIQRLSMLPENARVGFVHEGILRYSYRSKVISSKGPFRSEDIEIASRTRIALDRLSRSSDGRPTPWICPVRLTCKKHALKEQNGWLYKKAKGFKHRHGTWLIKGSEDWNDARKRELLAALEDKS